MLHTATTIASITNSDIVQLMLLKHLAINFYGWSTSLKDLLLVQLLLQATAVAGSTTLTLPAATDTLVGTRYN
jgi:hypothetical protein